MIAVLLTGGTIASTAVGSEGRFAPHVADPVKAVIKARSEAIGMEVGIEVWRILANEEMPLVDSCEMRPEHWCSLSAQIDQLAGQYSSVVVLHGTDSLAYSAAALSLLEPRRSVPVVFVSGICGRMKDDFEIFRADENGNFGLS